MVGAVVLTLALPWGFAATTLSARDWVLLVAAGLFAAAGHGLMIRAFQLAPPSLLAPFTYVQMLWAVAFGYAVFGQLPDRWSALGMAIIVGSGVLLALLERRRARLGAQLPLKAPRLSPRGPGAVRSPEIARNGALPTGGEFRYNFGLTGEVMPASIQNRFGESIMKKAIVAGLTALALAVTLSACGDKAKEAADAAKKSAEQAAAATKEAAAKAAEAAKASATEAAAKTEQAAKDAATATTDAAKAASDATKDAAAKAVDAAKDAAKK